MDSDRFDRLARVLAATSTRRAITRSMAGLSLGGALLAAHGETEARHKRHKKKKHCKPCQKRHHGKCKGTKPDGATCSGTGKCLAGRCNPRPTCLAVGADCTAETAGDCCSGVCLGNLACQISTEGEPCRENADCLTGRLCVAYVCRQP
jgi:hypothetical protein